MIHLLLRLEFQQNFPRKNAKQVLLQDGSQSCGATKRSTYTKPAYTYGRKIFPKQFFFSIETKKIKI
jgi:hypothetical protein